VQNFGVNRKTYTLTANETVVKINVITSGHWFGQEIVVPSFAIIFMILPLIAN